MFDYLKAAASAPAGELWAGPPVMARSAQRSTARCSTAKSPWTPETSRRWSPGAPAPIRPSRSPATCRTPGDEPDPSRRRGLPGRSTTWACRPASRWTALGISHAFIGSCTNGRLDDLRDAAASCAAAGSRRCPRHRRPRLERGARAGRGGGLDRVFRDAGFEWRQAGCSMCLAMNDDISVPATAAPPAPTATSKAARARAPAPI